MNTTVLSPPSGSLRDQFEQLHTSYRDAVRPHGCLEEFACQRLAFARLNYERAAALSLQSADPDKLQKLAFRWESSYNRALRELRDLQTIRAQANPNADAPLQKRCPERKRRVAEAPTMASPDPQPQPNQNFAKRNPLQEVGRNSPCPCGSGQKYKRCCGVNAPPILNQVA